MEDFLIFLIIPVYGMVMAILIILWMRWIRPYVKNNGRSVGHGANFGWVILSDVSIATEIAKEQKAFPWFIKVMWILEMLLFIIPLIAFAVMKV